MKNKRKETQGARLVNSVSMQSILEDERAPKRGITNSPSLQSMLNSEKPHYNAFSGGFTEYQNPLYGNRSTGSLNDLVAEISRKNNLRDTE